MTLVAHLVARDGIGSGALAGHPAGIEVRTERVDGRLRVKLMEGMHQVGSGLLKAERGHWQGTVSEYAGVWHVTGRCGDGTLTFSEVAP